MPGASEKEILVIAHLDQASTTVQGADNDGSGIAILLHLAEIFTAEKDRSYTLTFVATDAEEYGMIGAQRYVGTHPNTENIIAGISLDNLGRNYYDGMNMELIGQYRNYGPIWLALTAQEVCPRCRHPMGGELARALRSGDRSGCSRILYGSGSHSGRGGSCVRFYWSCPCGIL